MIRTHQSSIRLCLLAVVSLSLLALADKPKLQSVTLSGTSGLTESSGLAFSSLDANCVWTHNDSGDRARLFCFHTQTGALTGSCDLLSADSVDWESMTSVAATSDRATKLIVADSGDNDAVRANITLYRFDEPAPHKQTRLKPSEYETLRVRFPDGPVDCEAIWHDPTERCVLLLAKGRLPLAAVYRVADEDWGTSQSDPQGDKRAGQRIPNAAQENSRATKYVVTATHIATLALPMATGADRDPASGDVWIASYFQAFCFRRGQHANLVEQLGAVPLAIEMPRLRQIEAIAVDRESNVWVTSEGTPAILQRLATGKLHR
ncbi:esterase-like activity of phytase family protein [Aporhodopirellula aestuarii]|uniref:Esterase-like activity of phytase family protein n=1 Tax=Aporhodopirellula aestuarii TaxID=2950107 RepID=A0ABT0U7H6_9BACT|nr:esterase-like activity of phytase family protein [Aporhodopirellula aestuarii]MCM2372505.1 esterase-like activity of phytase family protein [Aporhodopirellula aestuarii]